MAPVRWYGQRPTFDDSRRPGPSRAAAGSHEIDVLGRSPRANGFGPHGKCTDAEGYFNAGVQIAESARHADESVIWRSHADYPVLGARSKMWHGVVPIICEDAGWVPLTTQSVQIRAICAQREVIEDHLCNADLRMLPRGAAGDLALRGKPFHTPGPAARIVPTQHV
jgi:hypothetical protein